MPLKLLLDILTGNMALVNVPSAPAEDVLIVEGNPMGLLLALTYPATP